MVLALGFQNEYPSVFAVGARVCSAASTALFGPASMRKFIKNIRKTAMTSLLILKRARTSLHNSTTLQRCYHAGRGGSVNTAIARGLRKSKGVGFRGKATLDPDELRENYRSREGFGDRIREPRTRDVEPRGPMRLERAPGMNDPERAGRFGEVIKGPTLRKMEYKERRDTGGSNFRSRDRSESFSSSRREEPFRERKGHTFSDPRERTASLNKRSRDTPSGTDRSGSSRQFGRDSKYADEKPSSWSRDAPRSQFGKDSRYGAEKRSSWNDEAPKPRFDRDAKYGNEKQKQAAWIRDAPASVNSRDERNTSRDDSRGNTFQRSHSSEDKYPTRNEKENDNKEVVKAKFTSLDKRIPISIPYTTPASEFLYGTHLVEAALNSKREPRRKLYKLYILADAGREDPARDDAIIRLAQKNKVEIVRVGKDGIPMMDKMSAGRPHNGYILEGSPLPKMPVKNLGAVGPYGFGVAIDHQSREEAEVNGTGDFISVPVKSTGKNPLVLLLDSIVDPGNLGGILRTAAFLGVSAVGISTRNSASFTPVVLKASAGASENITLFEVKKPAGFLVDSQANGWKVYAAVAPSKEDQPSRVFMSTNKLEDPLSEAPCILVLGSEGEGLRWNLRSKADVDLYIEGVGSRQNVDSLNVSVAAGILCSSFLTRKRSSKVTSQDIETLDSASLNSDDDFLHSGKFEDFEEKTEAVSGKIF